MERKECLYIMLIYTAIMVLTLAFSVVILTGFREFYLENARNSTQFHQVLTHPGSSKVLPFYLYTTRSKQCNKLRIQTMDDFNLKATNLIGHRKPQTERGFVNVLDNFCHLFEAGDVTNIRMVTDTGDDVMIKLFSNSLVSYELLIIDTNEMDSKVLVREDVYNSTVELIRRSVKSEYLEFRVNNPSNSQTKICLEIKLSKNMHIIPKDSATCEIERKGGVCDLNIGVTIQSLLTSVFSLKTTCDCQPMDQLGEVLVQIGTHTGLLNQSRDQIPRYRVRCISYAINPRDLGYILFGSGGIILLVIVTMNRFHFRNFLNEAKKLESVENLDPTDQDFSANSC